MCIRDSIKKIVHSDKVLVINMHNLYYANFNYVLNEWNTEYKYVLVQDANLPIQFIGSQEIYSNVKTKVKLYQL